MISIMSKNADFSVTITDDTISRYILKDNYYFSLQKGNLTLKVDTITRISPLLNTILIDSFKESISLPKDCFSTDDWMTIKNKMREFSFQNKDKIEENHLTSVIDAITNDCGIEVFKSFVETGPWKEDIAFKEINYRRLFTPILFKGEEGWVAATPFAKGIYDSIIQKGL